MVKKESKIIKNNFHKNNLLFVIIQSMMACFFGLPPKQQWLQCCQRWTITPLSAEYRECNFLRLLIRRGKNCPQSHQVS